MVTQARSDPPDLIAGHKVRKHPKPTPWLTKRLLDLMNGWELNGARYCTHVDANPNIAIATLAAPEELKCTACTDLYPLVGRGWPACDRCGESSNTVRGLVLDVPLDGWQLTVMVFLCPACKALEIL